MSERVSDGVEPINTQPNTLGIGDDLDDLDLIHDLETCFEVKFTDEETSDWYKVDDIFGSLKKRYETGVRQEHPATAGRAFYRLRRCIKSFNPMLNVSPRTRLDEIDSIPVRQLYRKLSADHNLRQPALYGGKVHTLGILIIFFGILTFAGLLIAGLFAFLLYALLIFAVGSVLIKFGAWKFPPDCETVGDLAQRIGARNFRVLNEANAPVRETELWQALLEIISDHSSIPKSEIRPDTLLLQSQLSRSG